MIQMMLFHFQNCKETTFNESEGVAMGSVENEISGNRKRIMKQQSSIIVHPDASLVTYLQSIVCMPRSLKILCLTNLFCWMAHVCYSLYFTDFVGEAVFNGSPTVNIKQYIINTLKYSSIYIGTGRK